MTKQRKPRGYYTKNKCASIALKYNSRSEFVNNSPSAYQASKRNKWVHDICQHMPEILKPRGYWNIKENCAAEALKYSTRGDFSGNSSSAYRAARRNKWLHDICQHMPEINVRWNYESCIVEALKYNTRSEFSKLSNGAYTSSWKNIWLDEVCSHMNVCGNIKKRAIYALFFNLENSVYIGLSVDPMRRLKEHLGIIKRKNQHINDNIEYALSIEDPEFIIFDGFYASDMVGREEDDIIYYFESLGYEILNIAKAGSLGGNTIKWNKNKCMTEALKYKAKIEFINNSNGAYKSAQRNGWLCDICKHMIN